MTARDDLVNNPKAFIRHNLLILHGAINDPRPEQVQPDGTMRLKLEDYSEYYEKITRTRNRKGLVKLFNTITGTVQTKATKFYYVSPADADGPETFFAYICPYRDNASLSRQLGNASNLMFTADMTGCSFGVGIPGQNGAVLVMHSNAKDMATPDSTAPQAAEQNNQLVQGGANRRMLEPGAYRKFDALNGVDIHATIIGVRGGKSWEFWYQQTNHAAREAKHMISVTKLRG